MQLTFGPGAALVSGGSGGIGSAVVTHLARAGVPTGFTYRSGREAADRLTGALLNEPGAGRVAAYPWHSSNFADTAKLVHGVRNDLGALHYLVVASGLAQRAAFHTLGEDEARNLIEANLAGALALARAAVTPMMKAGFGRIVLVGSVSGSRGIAGHTVYAATKAALEGFARALAREAGSFGVTVNCVAPGFIDTPMLESIPERRRKSWIERVPMRRLGRPDEVAGLVTYLLSEQAAYITGQTWLIDGGISA